MGEKKIHSHLLSFCASEEYLSVWKIKETPRTRRTQACPKLASNNGNTGEADASQRMERCLNKQEDRTKTFSYSQK